MSATDGATENSKKPGRGSRRTTRAKNLQITRELEPRREMKVVEQLDLMLDSKAATERDGSSPLLPSLRDIAS
jgi:hypothetical protein